MTFTDWLFSTCGGTHIGTYTCSKCGYSLVRSGLEKRVVVKTSRPGSFHFQGLLPFPPPTISARSNCNNAESSEDGKNRVLFNSKSMLEDFTRNFLLGRTFHKDSIMIELSGQNESPLRVRCGVSVSSRLG